MLYLGTLITLLIFCGKDLARLVAETFGILKDSLVNVLIFTKSVIGGTEPGYRRIVRSAYRKFTVLITVSVIPTIGVSVIGRGLIKSASSSWIIIGAGLLICGTVLLIEDLLQKENIHNEQVSPKGKTPKHVTYGDALLLGIGQSISLLPGISCFIVGYTMGIWRGFRKDFAVKYSLVMLAQACGINVILSMTKWNVDGIDVLSVFLALGKLFGTIVLSFILIRITQLTIQNNKFKYLAYFCYGAGVIGIINHIVNALTV